MCSSNQSQVFISGATGNVGKALLAAAQAAKLANQMVAGVRPGSTTLLPQGVTSRTFDFQDPSTFSAALAGCTVLFLIRPPQISEAKVFDPLILAAEEAGVEQVIFLSVQGAEGNRLIPHYKIEQRLKAAKMPYTFLRPAYFMENFLGEHLQEIKTRDRVFMPAGKARFTVISVEDIAEAALGVIKNPKQFKNQGLTLTNGQLLTFGQMCAQIGEARGKAVEFVSPNLLQFFLYQRKLETPTAFIFVKIMLHYLPRFSAAPKADNTLHQILNKAPLSFKDFAQKHKRAWINN